MSDRPWPHTARVTLLTGIVLATLGLIVGGLFLILGRPISIGGLIGLVALLTGIALIAYSFTYYPQHPDRIHEYDGRGDGIV